MSRDFSIHWAPLLPNWCLALIALVLFALLAQGCLTLRRKRVPNRSIVTLAILRGAAIMIFLLCLWQPVVSYERSTPKRSELLVLVDTSQSMGLPHSSSSTRLQHAVSQFKQSKLPAQLTQQFKTHWFAFDRQAHVIDTGTLSSLKPSGESTQYARSLSSAVDLLSAQATSPSLTPNIERVLLVSDGQDHGQEDLVDVAQRLGITVDVLPATVEDATSTASTPQITRVQSARRVLLGSETQFLITLAAGKQPAGGLTLVIEEDGREVQNVDVPATAERGEQQLTVSHRPSEPGLKRYDFSLRPKKAPATKQEPEHYALNVQVLDDRIEVLVLEDRWRWEFKYLRRVMEDDPSFNFTAMLSRGGKAYVQFGEPERQVNLGGFPQSRAELDWFDVIVLGDVHPSRWPRGLSSAIADAVIEGGKSLVLVAGPAMNQVAQVRELNALLPVELTSESAQPREGPIALQITPAGAQSPFFSGASGSIGQLPAVDSIYPPLRKRPGATVLVEAAEAANESGPLVVLAEQTVGRGRVLYIGADTLWKWQSLSPLDENGKTVYSRFWEQTFRALTPPRTAKSATLSLQADRSRYEAGSRALLRAKLPAEHVSDELTLQASVVLPDEQRIPLAFTPDQAESGVFVSQFETMLPGSYRVALAATTNGQLVGETSLAVEVTADRTELDDAGIDLARLTRIASRTGGKVVDLAEPQTWPAPASATPPMIQETHTTNLLENLWLVVLLCGVLGSDWLLRLLRGLV